MTSHFTEKEASPAVMLTCKGSAGCGQGHGQSVCGLSTRLPLKVGAKHSELGRPCGRGPSLLLCRLWSQHTGDFSRCLSELIQSSLLRCWAFRLEIGQPTYCVSLSLYPFTTPSVQPFICPSVGALVCLSILHLPPLF